MAQECPSSPTGRHNWALIIDGRYECSYCRAFR